MSLASPQGYPYQAKTMNPDGSVTRVNRIAMQETVFMKWVVNYWLEGSLTDGANINVDSPPDNPAYPFMIWRAEITTPDTPEARNFHGHFRTRSIVL